MENSEICDLLNKDQIQIKFESEPHFRRLAPYNVAKGAILLTNNNLDDELDLNRNIANIADIMQKSVPTTQIQVGKNKFAEVPLYSAKFTEPMWKEIESQCKSQSVELIHQQHVDNVTKYLTNFEPTISLNESLYRLSFYLISNENNLAKSTNLLVSFVKKILLGQANNILVDSAILIGGQGKSTIQKGLLNAAEQIGFGTTTCNLPTHKGGTSEVFVKNEICVDDETTFKDLDTDALNDICDKAEITIKGKYIKEWRAKSVANILVGTNFLPTDVNTRRYSVRMVDENFKLIDNFGAWGIPGTKNDNFGDSYEKVIDWTTEAWLNLFYYCNKYDIKELPFKNEGFDYGLQYKIKKACDVANTTELTIDEIVKWLQTSEDEKFDFRTKQSLKNQLYICANKLKLPKVEEHKNMFSTYDWSLATHMDESDIGRDNLEIVYCFFHNEDRFNNLI